MPVPSFFYLHAVDVQTPTAIEELSITTPRPVAIYLCESAATATHE
ncbi:hypothetical protein [Lysinibacillus xylanilyticus]